MVPAIDNLSFKVEYSDDAYARERELGSFSPNIPFNFGLEYRPLEGVELEVSELKSKLQALEQRLEQFMKQFE